MKALCLLAFTLAAVKTRDTEVIKRKYDARSVAVRHGDLTWVDKQYTKGFKIISLVGGRNDFQWFREVIRSTPAYQGKAQAYSISATALRRDQSRIVATVRESYTIKLGPAGRTHTLDRTIEFEERWVKTTDGWRVDQLTELRHRLLKDGRAISNSR